SSIDRFKEGIILKNKFQWEIRNFYPNEFKIGEKGLEIIKKEFGIELGEDEASFIAMHVISSEIGGDMEDFYEQTSFIQQTTNIVKYYFSTDFDEDSLDYYRFVTHLKFFWHRITRDKNKKMQDMENDILEIIKNKRVEAYLCSLKVKQFIEKNYQYELTNEEILYLTIHISRMTQKLPMEE
ncbi:MAG: PRD domain-containing protein, partial [Tetragenococcus koreensis]|nr:PRD domain-containing protein [Tetragenococcus koreensis]